LRRIRKDAGKFQGIELADRLGEMAGRIARRLAPEHGWSDGQSSAASHVIAQVLDAFAGDSCLDVSDVSGLLEELFASRSIQARNDAATVFGFMANLLAAISPPSRIYVLRKASSRDLQRAHRYWRTGMLFAERLAIINATSNITFRR
jgi:hypothetical protein